MIIKQILFNNFLTYHGTQSVKFPTVGERTLTIVVGPNNSGKTSFIRALKFWFYGESGVPRKADLPSFLCNKAKANTPVGGSLTGWVEVSFERAGGEDTETYCLRRTIEGKRVTADRWESQAVQLLKVMNGVRPIDDAQQGGRLQRMIEAMVPKALFDAFYFKGEPLDGKLLGDVGSIRQALGQFLHEDEWKEAEESAASIRDDLAKRLSKLTAANSDLTRKLTDQSQNQVKLDAQRAALRDEEAALRDAEVKYAQEADNLSKLGDEEAAREVKGQHSRALQRRDSARNQLAQIDQDIQREVNQSLGIPFLIGAVEPVKAILAEMEKENILPADITPGFVDRVLAKAACICGKTHDDDSRAHWETYRKKTLATDAGEGLRKLLDWVKPQGSLSIHKRSEQITTELKRLTEQHGKSVLALNEGQSAVTAAQAAMENVPVEEIARIGRALNSLQAEIKSKTSRIQTIGNAVHGTEYVAKQLKEEIQQLSSKAGVDQKAFSNLSAAKERAERLHQALTSCRGRLSRYFHRVLQASVANFYDSKATDGSKAHIDRQTLLPSIQVKGQKTQNLGGGQSQLLALAYVVSLARMRQDMHTQMERLGVRLGKIDDLSFFMDSPFGNMEKHYKEAAIQLVPGCARQVILLLWKEEWDFARDYLEAEAASIYAIQFFTTSDDIKKISKDYRAYDFSAGKEELIQSLPAGDDQPHSELLRIK
jgi:DNA sulfur modification protein DndD